METKAQTVKMRQVLLPVVVLVAAVWGGLMILRTQLGARPTGAEPAAAEDARFLAQVGATLPALHLHPLFDDGKPKLVTLAEMPGKKLFLINFWATWCEACMVEMPSLVRLREKLKGQGFEVLGVNLDEIEDNRGLMWVAGIVKKLGIQFSLFKDEGGELADLFDLSAIPVSVIVNAKGRILFMDAGDRKWDSPDNLKLVEGLLEGGTAP